MLSKAKISLIRSLSQSKFRKESGLFIAEGPKLVLEISEASHLQVEEIFAIPEWIGRYPEMEKRHRITAINSIELDRISQLSTPNEVLALVTIPQYSLPDKNQLSGLILALDSIRDPGNLGTIIRTADWFGVRHILCSPDCVEPWNPKVIQASMGSIGRIFIHSCELAGVIASLKPEFLISGAGMTGVDMQGLAMPHDMVLVIGSESHGLSKDVSRHLDAVVTIPRALDSQAESLNASIAASIITAHWRSQHT